MKKLLLVVMALNLMAVHAEAQAATALQPANTSPGQTDSNDKPIPYVNRTIEVDLVVLEQQVNYNRLGNAPQRTDLRLTQRCQAVGCVPVNGG